MTRTDIALALFRFLDERGIAYCVMGDSRGFPQTIHSDIDIVVAPPALLPLAMRLPTFCARYGLRLVQCLQHEHNACYFVLSWPDEKGMPEFLAVDFCSDYYRRGKRFLGAHALLADRRAALDRDGKERGFTIAAPAHEFIYYLLKRIDKEDLADIHGGHLTAQWYADTQGAREQVQRFWTDQLDIATLTRAAETGAWSGVRDALPRLRKELHKRLPISFAATAREFGRRIRRWFYVTGLVVACLGPDGSGKSTIIGRLVPLLQPAFRRVQVMHLRPRLGSRASSAAPVTTPQAEPVRGWLGSILKPLYFLADYGLGYLLKLRPALARSTLVVFDRHYQDLLIDPRRYRYGASMGFARWIGRFIPRPDLWLVLDAPIEVMQSRKREVTPDESARQREAYLRLAASVSNASVVDTSRSIDVAVATASDAILHHLAKRTAARLPAADNPAGTRVLLFFCRNHVPLLSRLIRIVYNSDIYAKLPRSVCLPHPYGVVIHSQALIGERVTIMQQVTIGGKDVGENVAPIIGDDVYIGAGAKLLGGLRVGIGATIGANAVVTRDVPPYATVVGANRLVLSQNPMILHRETSALRYSQRAEALP